MNDVRSRTRFFIRYPELLMYFCVLCVSLVNHDLEVSVPSLLFCWRKRRHKDEAIYSVLAGLWVNIA